MSDKKVHRYWCLFLWIELEIEYTQPAEQLLHSDTSAPLKK